MIVQPSPLKYLFEYLKIMVAKFKELSKTKRLFNFKFCHFPYNKMDYLKS